MFYTYAICSLSRKYIYVGITNSFDRRFSEHQLGYNKTTKPYRPFAVLFIEEHATRENARNREKYLKSGAGKEFLKAIFIKTNIAPAQNS